MTCMPHNLAGRIDTIQAACRHFISNEFIRHGIEGVVPSHGVLVTYLHQAACPVQVMSLVVALKRPKSTITKATDCLERAGYVHKKSNPADGRSYLVELTEEGHSFFKTYQGIVKKLENKAFAGFSESDCQNFDYLLSDLESRLY